MAKESKEVAVKEESKVVALTSGGGFEAYAGFGFEEVRSEDAAIPFLRVLGQLSPQINKRDGKYVAGAEAGMILNTVQNAAYDGEKGVRVIPCYFAPRYLEWRPRTTGGGFVTSYTPEEAEPLLKKCTRNDRNEDILPNGNLLANTAQFFVLFLTEEGAQRALVSMSSTQLKKARRWNAQMGSLTGMGSRGIYTLPSFGAIYRLTTVAESNDKGDWFGWDVKIERKLDEKNVEDMALFQQAAIFHKSVKVGDVKVKHEDSVDNTPSAEMSDDIPF